MRRLERSTTNRVVAGVCGGLGEHLQIDPTLVRAFFVVASIFTAFAFVLVYVALLLLMPLPGKRSPVDEWFGTTTSPSPPPSREEVGGGPAEAAPPPSVPAADRDVASGRNLAAWLLIALGVVFLIGNVGGFRLMRWDLIWPLALIAFGVFMLLQRSRP